MKKLVLSAFIASSVTVAFAKEITFAMEATYPPFETTNVKGEIVGFDVDVAKAICKKINATCYFKNEAFDALIPSLIKNRGGFNAAISAIDITDERAKKVAFTMPYYDSSASFIGTKNKMMNDVKKVGVQNGTTYKQYIVEQGKQYEAKSYANIQDAIVDLKTGRIDVVFGDTAVLVDAMEKEPNLQFVGEKVTDKRYFGNGFGIALNKKNKALLADLNKGIALIKADGEYQEIYNKWFNK